MTGPSPLEAGGNEKGNEKGAVTFSKIGETTSQDNILERIDLKVG